MKFKSLLLTLTFIFAFAGLFADKVELKEAQEVATKFYNQKYLVNNPDATASFYITETFTTENEGEDVMYIFNFSNGGYAVVPADDRLYPVVGFSFSGAYNPDMAPENCKYVIRNFGKQVTHVRTNNVQSDVNAQAWANLRSENSENLSFLLNNRDVEPMVTALWNQNYPYNALCPDDPTGPGGHVYAGCVATAMSMIMYHWRYPEYGTGSHSYYASGYGQLSVNFGASTYDYSGMVNSSDNKYNFEIAQLQYHCGVAVDMMYGPDGSGAYSDDVPQAIKSYFGYSNSAQYYPRGGWAAWQAYLNQQIADYSQPVYYSGQDNNGGHAFVVDGMQEQGDETFYHFNFGWSGSGNGWYLATDAGGYNSWNAMIKNFIPDENNYPYDPPEELVTITHLNGTIEDCSGPKADYEPNINSSWLISPQTAEDSVSYIRITFDRFETQPNYDVVRLYDGDNVNAPLLGEFSGNEIPEMIYSTGNQVLITFTTDATIEENGWMISFKAYQPTWCSGMQAYTEPNATFDDGSGTFFYNNGQTCMWTIEPQWASSATLYFNALDTEEGKDVLKVFDLSTQQLLAEVSGNVIPEPITSPSGRFYLLFSTNGTVRGDGWEVYYEADNVGVSEQNAEFGNFNLYPNPAQDEINLTFVSKNNESVNVSLYTTTGVNVYSSDLKASNGQYFNTIDVSNLSRGVYLLRVNSQQGTMVRKVVVE